MVVQVEITSPCQDFSLAGFKNGLQGLNGQLLLQACQIYQYVKKYNPDVAYFREETP